MFKLLELLHHFNKVHQTAFLRKYILVFENRQIKHQFYGHYVRSNLPLQFLKTLKFYGDVFLKNKTCLNHEFFIITKYRQTSFRSKNFNYERPLLHAVEITISFYWFSNRSPLLKVDGNSTKVTTSNTNFNNKYQLLKVTIRM